MAWSSEFIDWVSGGRREGGVWILEVVVSNTEPQATDGYRIASVEGYGDVVAIAAVGPTISGPRLSPVTWSSSIGTIRVPLVGDMAAITQQLTRGTICRLLLGQVGWSVASQFETVAWGQVISLRGSGGRYDLELQDPLRAISQRLSNTAPELFSGNGATTTLTGAHSELATTITVNSTSGFIMDNNGYVIGLIQIGSELITYTGKTATTFTLPSTDNRGAFGTTKAAYAGGETVTELAILAGHPLDIARRVILSHPEAGNSEWDDYDSSWGLAVRQSLVDIDDIENFKQKVVLSTMRWDVAVAGTVDDAGAWLASLLAKGGMFLTTRQGLLTVRGAQLPNTISTPPVSEIEIVEADIVDGWGGILCEAWATEQPTEYAGVSTQSATGTTTYSETTLATLPGASAAVLYDCSDVIWFSEAGNRQDISDRLAIMACRVPEAIQLTCAGMRLAQLTPGDVVYLRSERVGIRFSYTGGTSGRRGMVTQVSPDWARNEVKLRILFYPTYTTAFEPDAVSWFDTGV